MLLPSVHVAMMVFLYYCYLVAPAFLPISHHTFLVHASNCHHHQHEQEPPSFLQHQLCLWGDERDKGMGRDERKGERERERRWWGVGSLDFEVRAPRSPTPVPLEDPLDCSHHPTTNLGRRWLAPTGSRWYGERERGIGFDWLVKERKGCWRR